MEASPAGSRPADEVARNDCAGKPTGSAGDQALGWEGDNKTELQYPDPPAM